MPSVQQNGPTAALSFRRNATRIAGDMLKSWVGEDRAAEATGRIAAALAASAGAARDPGDFYACTIESVGTCVAISALTGILPGVGSTALAYVVPQRARKGEPPQLQYQLSHRGLNALARRCGQTMIAVPISTRDRLDVDEGSGEVRIRARDIDNPPVTFEDLRGVMISVREVSTGVTICREFVPKVLIEKRRAMSRSFNSAHPEYSPWVNWPVEMSMKVSMHYAIGRGWCVIDDTSAERALRMDVEADLSTPALLTDDGGDAPRLSHDVSTASGQLADMLGDRTETAQEQTAQEQTDVQRHEAPTASAEISHFTTLKNKILKSPLSVENASLTNDVQRLSNIRAITAAEKESLLELINQRAAHTALGGNATT